MEKQIKYLQKEAREILKREFELAEYLDKYFWQKGYPKMKNQLERKIDIIIEQSYEIGRKDNSAELGKKENIGNDIEIK